MPKNRTRDRQLAKLAARRQAERHAVKRRRGIMLGMVGAVVAVVLVVIGFRVLTDDGAATATPTPSDSVIPTVEPGAEPTVTGEVTPLVDPPAEVACGAEVPKEAGEAKSQFDRAPGIDSLDPALTYRATIETSCGTIDVELEAALAPQTVASFVFLAREGYFDGLTFHRVVPGFVVQAGDPLGDGTGGPGYAFPDELGGRLQYDEGVVAMANSGPNTNGSQWFIVSGPDGANLNDIPNYTIFGNVREGMDVVEAIEAVPIGAGDVPSQAVYIERVTIEEREAPPSEGGAPASESP